MDGSTHKVIAPIFTLGVTTAYLTTCHIDMPLGVYSTVGIATISSYFSACWPDADQHAKYMPLPVIWAGFTPITDTLLKPYGVKRIRKRIQNSSGHTRYGKAATIYRNKKYPRIRGFMPRVWATLFRVFGLRKHRDWRSHSPLLWVPLWYCIYFALNSIPYLGTFLGPIAMGFGLGYISHIIGDLFTKSGVPLLPDFGVIEHIPVVNHFTEVKVFRGGFFKANNKVWNYIVIVLIADFALFLIAPDIAKDFNLAIFNSLYALLVAIKEIIIATITQ